MTIKELEKSIARIRVFQDELESEVEERERMISVLLLVPSSNDNLDLINQLEKIVRVMKYFEEDLIKVIKDGISNDEHDKMTIRYESLVNQYETITSNLNNDPYIDITEYRYEKSEIPKPSLSVKLVRFKDNLIEEEPEPYLTQQLMNGATKYKPYIDDEDGNSDSSSIASSFDAATNQQMFAQHQQQLLEQDNDLGFLSDSVRRQHQMGVTMNNELDEHLILLNDLESGVDRAYTRLGQAQHRLKNFQILCKENGSMVTIIVLTIILFGLLVVLN